MPKIKLNIRRVGDAEGGGADDGFVREAVGGAGIVDAKPERIRWNQTARRIRRGGQPVRIHLNKLQQGIVRRLCVAGHLRLRQRMAAGCNHVIDVPFARGNQLQIAIDEL